MLWSLTVFVAIFIITAEIFTVLLQLTGLPKDKARFQIISILTSTGFTTKESELITVSKIRRKIALAVMVFGYCSTVSFGTLLIGIIRRSYTVKEFVIAIVIMAIFFLIFMNDYFRSYLDDFIAKKANELFFGSSGNHIVVIESFNKNVIAEIILLNIGADIENIPLCETELTKKHNIMILAIERNKGSIFNVGKDDVIKKGDRIVVYGDQEIITQVFGVCENI